jgi:hypothetical protein
MKSPVKMTADGGPRTAKFHSWWCAAAHEISLENDGGRRTFVGGGVPQLMKSPLGIVLVLSCS